MRQITQLSHSRFPSQGRLSTALMLFFITLTSTLFLASCGSSGSDTNSTYGETTSSGGSSTSGGASGSAEISGAIGGAYITVDYSDAYHISSKGVIEGAQEVDFGGMSQLTAAGFSFGYEANGDNPYILVDSRNAATHRNSARVEPLAAGYYEGTFTANSGMTYSLGFTWDPKDSRPRIANELDTHSHTASEIGLTMAEDTGGCTDDDVNDVTSMSIVSSNTSVLSVSMSGDIAWHTVEGVGTAIATVTCTSNGLSDQKSFTVTVS